MVKFCQQKYCYSRNGPKFLRKLLVVRDGRPNLRWLLYVQHMVDELSFKAPCSQPGFSGWTEESVFNMPKFI